MKNGNLGFETLGEKPKCGNMDTSGLILSIFKYL